MYIKSIGKYGAALDYADAEQIGREALELVRTWRNKLGDKSNLLDKYLNGIVTAISETICVTETAQASFVEALGELRRLCGQIKEGKEDEAQKHPFYPKVKLYMETHTIPDDNIYYEVLCVGLFNEFSAFAEAQFIEECDARLKSYLDDINIPAICEMFIGAGAGLTADDLDHLYDLVMRLFVRISPAAVFMQGMIEQISTSIISQDRKSGEYVFHRLLENKL